MATAKVISKITIADLGIKVPRLDIDEKGEPLPANVVKTVHLYDLYGQLYGYRTGVGKGDKTWVQFKGQFQAVIVRNADTGEVEVIDSGRAHVPSAIEDLIYGELKAAKEKDPESTILIALRIAAKTPKPGKPSATGYEFTVEMIEDTRVNNPLLEMRNRVMQKLPQLPRMGVQVKTLAAPVVTVESAAPAPTVATAQPAPAPASPPKDEKSEKGGSRIFGR